MSLSPQNQKAALVTAVQRHLEASQGFDSIVVARRFATDVLREPVQAGTPLAKLVEEAIESATVRVARDLIAANRQRSWVELYDLILDLHYRLPTLGTRTSQSMIWQQYSTPLPIAFVAASLARIDETTSVFDATAGNGALLITTAAEHAIANEIDPQRVAELKKQGLASVNQFNALDEVQTWISDALVEVVLLNPPFGKGKTPNGKNITSQDKQIALHALQAMQPDGRAVLILASENERLTPEYRSDAYNELENRRFYKQLYDRYNVVEHLTLSGDLYRKQGCGYPIDLIVIEGQSQSQRALPAVQLPHIIKTYQELRTYLEQVAEHGFVEPEAPVAERTRQRVKDDATQRLMDVLCSPLQLMHLRFETAQALLSRIDGLEPAIT